MATAVRQAGARGEGFSQVRGPDLAEHASPARAKSGSRHRLLGDQQHDKPRHAGLAESRLSTGAAGEIYPHLKLRTKAL